MKIGRSLLAIFALLLFYASLIHAASYGLNLSYPLYTAEPDNLHGLQFLMNYHPDRYTWDQLHLYFDGGVLHLSGNDTPYYSTINIYSFSPVLRYTFNNKNQEIKPYCEISIGLAYLNQTHIQNKNLGIHFAFQDRIGIGAQFGRNQQLSLGIHAAHYSNAHLSGHNSGITIPVMLDVGYQFS